MKRILHGLAAMGLLVIGPSCSTAIPGEFGQPFGFSTFGRADFEDTDNDGLPDTRLPDFGRRTIAKLDDITNGTDDRSGAELGSGTEPGIFYDDGSDGDLFGRSATFFTTLGHARVPIKVVAPDPIDQPVLNAIDRKMIYSASYAVMVSVVDEAIRQLTTRVTELGGYLSQRNNATLTVRVPAAKFSSFIAEIPALGRVISESMNANDVTNQHTDLTIRLENAEKSRQRLLVLIEKATKIEDIVKIEAALRRLTGEIERMKGQLKLMNDQVAYSTVSVSFQANAPKAKATKHRQQSRFPWINRIGIEQDLRRF